MFDSAIPIDQILIRLTLAGILAGVIGWEREGKNKAAGLRTHMLVSLASATFTLVGLEFALTAAEAGEPIDALRIVQAIATGVGFIGAGTILQQKNSVKGLTTAGGLWAAGAIGLAAGTGQIILAGATTLLVVITLALVGRLEQEAFSSEDEQEE